MRTLGERITQKVPGFESLPLRQLRNGASLKKGRKVPSVGKFKRRSFKIKFEPIFSRNSFWDSKFLSSLAECAEFKVVTKSLPRSNQLSPPVAKSRSFSCKSFFSLIKTSFLC